MKSILCSIDVLSRLSLFTVLGLAIFLSGCSDYSHTQKYIFESEIANIRAAYIDKLVHHRIKIQGTKEQSHRSENGPFSASVNITETFHTR